MSLRFLLSTVAVAASILVVVFVPIFTQSCTRSRSNDRPKVFVIGLSKTGTTSLGDALAILGYRRSGWEDLRSRWLYHAWSRGHLAPLVCHTRRFDAFEDIPWAQAYKDFAELYPSAKFVLSLRKNETTWLKSIDTHTTRRLWDGHKDIYGCYEASECPESYLNAYRKHNEEVIRYFAERNESHRLLQFTIDGQPTGQEVGATTSVNGTGTPRVDAKWKVLVEFLEQGGSASRIVDLEALGQFPTSNGRNGKGNRDQFKVHWAVDRCIFYVEHSTVVFSALAGRIRSSLIDAI